MPGPLRHGRRAGASTAGFGRKMFDPITVRIEDDNAPGESLNRRWPHREFRLRRERSPVHLHRERCEWDSDHPVCTSTGPSFVTTARGCNFEQARPVLERQQRELQRRYPRTRRWASTRSRSRRSTAPGISRRRVARSPSTKRCNRRVPSVKRWPVVTHGGSSTTKLSARAGSTPKREQIAPIVKAHYQLCRRRDGRPAPCLPAGSQTGNGTSAP